MEAPGRLPDDALVVRCGRPPYDRPNPLHERCEEHEGVFGFSVQCAAGQSFDRLAGRCPNRFVGVTTVGKIRAFGYDVVVTSGAGFHATVSVPKDWGRDDADRLARVFAAKSNPAPRKMR